MMNLFPIREWWRVLVVVLVCLGSMCDCRELLATDYFLTIGGGYKATQNQASLEANIVFFQRILAEKHQGPLQHQIFFADGNDAGADLQVLAEKPAKSKTPATDLLDALHRRDRDDPVTYRNHQIPGVAGPLDPKLVRNALETLAKTARSGDRLIIFVTAHGSEGEEDDDEYNTTIDCWNDRKILARDFTGWLDKLPTDLPVVMVMAQCYCGGFSRTIFTDLNEEKGIAPHLRVGFFAQQHDLPAAGCRPDIEHDEEFSSYFWGAIAGRSRNGVPIAGVDANGDGIISFAEAYAHMVIAGETIDIPLRTSEVFLQTYSKLPREKGREGDGEKSAEETAKAEEDAKLFSMSGKLEDLIAGSRPVSARIVKELAKSLELSLQDDVSKVLKRSAELRQNGRSGRGRGRQSSGRRELLKEVAEKWPELGDDEKWEDSSLLRAENQEALLAEIQNLPSFKTYEERRKQREEADKVADQREVKSVKFRRLVSTLEAVVLEKNLPLVANPEMVKRYEQMVALEETGLNGAAVRK